MKQMEEEEERDPSTPLSRVVAATLAALQTVPPVSSASTFGDQRSCMLEGGLFLLREVCAAVPDQASLLLDVVADVASDTQATAPHVQETVWRVLPACARSVGGKALKRHLDGFLQPLAQCIAAGASKNGPSGGRVGGKKAEEGEGARARRLGRRLLGRKRSG